MDSDGSEEIRYIHRDHLGSIDKVTDDAGLIVDSYSFDAFGLRRDPANWTLSVTPTTEQLDFSRYGYTDHEQIDNMGIVHMNGRIYDPQLGRMMQADPFVQFPAYGQSYNRYAYVLNNPLTFTDPSGYMTDGPLEQYEDRFACDQLNGGARCLGFGGSSFLRGDPFIANGSQTIVALEEQRAATVLASALSAAYASGQFSPTDTALISGVILKGAFYRSSWLLLSEFGSVNRYPNTQKTDRKIDEIYFASMSFDKGDFACEGCLQLTAAFPFGPKPTLRPTNLGRINRLTQAVRDGTRLIAQRRQQLEQKINRIQRLRGAERILERTTPLVKVPSRVLPRNRPLPEPWYLKLFRSVFKRTDEGGFGLIVFSNPLTGPQIDLEIQAGILETRLKDLIKEQQDAARDLENEIFRLQQSIISIELEIESFRTGKPIEI